MKVKEFRKGEPDHYRTVSPSIGIDASLTGFAVCAYGDDENYAVDVYIPDTRGPERLAELVDCLRVFVTTHAPGVIPEQIAIEGTVRMSASASVLGELTGAVKVAVWRRFGDPPMLNIPPMSAKKYASGSGKAVTKSQMLLAVFKKYGAEFTDDNACDAFVMARIAKGVATTKYEQEVLTKLDDPKFRN